MQFHHLLLIALASHAICTNADASLIDRGGGLIYDDVLDVTWLQDAAYARTSGYDPDGLMNLQAATAWASGLVFHDSVRNVTYSDWRLPSVRPVGADFNYGWSQDGSTDFGYNITSPNSELSYMYYVALALTGYYSPNGTYQPNNGIFGDGTTNGPNQNVYYGESDVGLIKNLQAYSYWSGSEYLPDPSFEWVFFTSNGYQVPSYKGTEYYAWAVRDGDVASLPSPVPEPGTLPIMGVGIVILGMLRSLRGSPIM